LLRLLLLLLLLLLSLLSLARACACCCRICKRRVPMLHMSRTRTTAAVDSIVIGRGCAQQMRDRQIKAAAIAPQRACCGIGREAHLHQVGHSSLIHAQGWWRR
jgi:hypothetical protein